MYASVIVDVPARQVNRPFDYKLPDDWQDLIELGMRVEVPFANRQVMGFVVGLSQEIDYQGQVKEISRLLDYHSYLNEELVQLSAVMADQLDSFRINVLQAMLPSMLKVKYENVFVVNRPDQVQELHPEINHAEYPKQDLEACLSTKEIASLIRQGYLELEYRLQDQRTKKLETYVTSSLNHDQYQDQVDLLDKRSHKQRLLLEFILDQDLPLKLSIKDFMDQAQVSRANVNTAIDKGWLTASQEEVYRDPLAQYSPEASQAKPLTPEQATAYTTIKEAMINKQSTSYLIEGVTGSGKTEVYLQLMQVALDQGQSAILLVPEISLTPQMVDRVLARFGRGIAVLHSNLSASERYDEWRRILKGEAKIVVGARSSIFAPLDNLGLIIIDEEHESTYKQSDNPRYHARDVAKWRADYHSIPLVLGSATPSLESRARAEVGNYQLIRLQDRVNQSALPPVDLIDMSQLMVSQTDNELSPALYQAIQDNLDRQEQTVLLLNRRGYSAYLLCRECGYVVGCPHCDISLTYHKEDQSMKCHYCGYQEAVPRACPQCGSQHIRRHGLGTQKVEESLLESFPQARIIRMDNDTTKRKGAHKKLLEQFANHQADILLGTQMIAKGLDFERVTLVGVINADTSLNLPDFRAGERTFQLLTQVAGRTGRGQYPGRVLVQTYNPDHYVIQLAQRHDYEGFFYQEMQRRHLANYPPYYYTTLITIKGKKLAVAEANAYELRALLSRPDLEQAQRLIILGPNQAAIFKIKDYYHYQIILKYKDKDDLQAELRQILDRSQEDARSGILISIDHEPLYFM